MPLKCTPCSPTSQPLLLLFPRLHPGLLKPELTFQGQIKPSICSPLLRNHHGTILFGDSLTFYCVTIIWALVWSSFPAPLWLPALERQKRHPGAWHSACACVFSRLVMSDSATPRTVTHQAPLSIGFSRQEYWGGLAECGHLLNKCSRVCCCCSSFTKLCATLWDPMDCSMPGHPVPYFLPEFAQECVLWIGDAIQLSHPLPPYPPLAHVSKMIIDQNSSSSKFSFSESEACHEREFLSSFFWKAGRKTSQGSPTNSCLKKCLPGTSLVVQWLGLWVFNAVGTVWPLVEELRSRILHSTAQN